ncbi:MAG: hypothetical protein R3B54_02190 [Bdellovibrionota bacterium]
MPNPTAPLGKYELSLGSKKWDDCLNQVEFHSEVDEPSRLIVALAVNAKELGQLNGSSLPATASLKWQDMGVFKGSLIHSRVVSHSKLVLTFADSLFASKKTMLNGFYKKQSLKEVLEKLSKEAGLKVRFQGTFAEKLPGLNVGGKAVFDLFTSLAAKYGFYFSYRSYADTLYFVRIGESIKAQKLDCREEAADISIGQAGSEGTHKSHSVTLIPNPWRPRKRKWESPHSTPNSAALPSTPPTVTRWTGLRPPAAWSRTSPIFTISKTQKICWEASLSNASWPRRCYALRFSKPAALPGDKLQLSESPAGALQDGDYLVKSMALFVNSALPYAEIHGIRP